MIVAKIFRELDLTKSDDFIAGLFQLIAEVGLPKNVEIALIYYIKALKEKIPAENISSLKQSVLQSTPIRGVGS